ncbi:hypothetical protein RRF57_003693 [Xylaria bambusicola]|uniref:Uncharacterized protein n=1 Tax=Xylaria bambusicola TaxID=326684 RepID=A0AAN7UHW0_9PEZI
MIPEAHLHIFATGDVQYEWHCYHVPHFPSPPCPNIKVVTRIFTCAMMCYVYVGGGEVPTRLIRPLGGSVGDCYVVTPGVKWNNNNNNDDDDAGKFGFRLSASEEATKTWGGCFGSFLLELKERIDGRRVA